MPLAMKPYKTENSSSKQSRHSSKQSRHNFVYMSGKVIYDNLKKY